MQMDNQGMFERRPYHGKTDMLCFRQGGQLKSFHKPARISVNWWGIDLWCVKLSVSNPNAGLLCRGGGGCCCVVVVQGVLRPRSAVLVARRVGQAPAARWRGGNRARNHQLPPAGILRTFI